MKSAAATSTEQFAHVLLSEPCVDPRSRPGVPGQSVRLNGKIHDFSALIPLYGKSFTIRLLDAFARKYVHDTPSTTEKRCGNLRKFLVYLAGFAAEPANQNTPAARSFQALVENTQSTIKPTEWSDTVEVFVSRPRDLGDFSITKSSNAMSRQNVIESLSVPLQDLSQEGLWPTIEPLRGVPGSRISRQNIPAFGELKRPGDAPETSSQNSVTYKEMTELNRERLQRLRLLCEDTLLEEEAAFDHRLKLVNAPNQPSLDEICAAVPLISSRYSRLD
jgi:hypothetical protein